MAVQSLVMVECHSGTASAAFSDDGFPTAGSESNFSIASINRLEAGVVVE